jgi:hypothetical protein
MYFIKKEAVTNGSWSHQAELDRPRELRIKDRETRKKRNDRPRELRIKDRETWKKRNTEKDYKANT